MWTHFFQVWWFNDIQPTVHSLQQNRCQAATTEVIPVPKSITFCTRPTSSENQKWQRASEWCRLTEMWIVMYTAGAVPWIWAPNPFVAIGNKNSLTATVFCMLLLRSYANDQWLINPSKLTTNLLRYLQRTTTHKWSVQPTGINATIFRNLSPTRL